MKKIQNFITKQFERTMIHLFVPSFAETGKAKNSNFWPLPLDIAEVLFVAFDLQPPKVSLETYGGPLANPGKPRK